MRGYGAPPQTATPLEAYTRLVKDGRLAPDEGQAVVMKKLQVTRQNNVTFPRGISGGLKLDFVLFVCQIGRP